MSASRLGNSFSWPSSCPCAPFSRGCTAKPGVDALALPYAIGSVAMFWVIERVSSFFEREFADLRARPSLVVRLSGVY